MAARFWIGQSGGGNYNSTDWSTTSGGSGGSAAPTSSDAVTFDGAGTFGNTNCTITANAVALSVTFTSGYTATLTINSNITWTVSGSFTDNTAHSYSFLGTQNAGQLTISATATITSGGKTFPGNVTFSGSNTKTLSGNWTITGTLTCSTTTTTINKTASEVLSCAGFTVAGTTAGNCNITLTGGRWSGSGSNTMRGTITFNGSSVVSSVKISGATIVWSSGTIDVTGSTLTVNGSSTFNTNGMSWNNITVNATATITINSLLTVNGTLQAGASNSSPVVFTGTAGFTTTTLSIIQIQTSTITLQHSVTYTVISSFSCFASRTGSPVTIASDDGTLKANLVLSNDATTCNVLANFTRIDASGGRPIITFNGTITDCVNIYKQSNVIYKPIEQYNRGRRRFNLTNSNKTVLYQ